MSGFLKDYEPVEDRLREFWEDNPNGAVLTKLLAHEDGLYIVHAEVYRKGSSLSGPDATGLAQDSVDKLPQNMKASALEVCETSAIGRALANLGYAAKGKRPSREEMQKASASVEPDTVPTGGSVSAGVGKADADGSAPPSPGAVEADPTRRGSEGSGEGPTGPLHTSEQGVPSPGSEGVNPAPGDAASPSDAALSSSGTTGEETVASSAGSTPNLDEQKKAYYDAFRAGPGLPNAFMAAKKLFSTEARPIKRWDDFYALSPDELFEVARYFEEAKTA